MDQNELLKIIEKAAKEKETELNLSSKSITSLPAEIGQLKNLTVLSLSGNRLTSIPVELGQLKSLEGLYLRDNYLTDVPAELFQLKNLMGLHLDGNQLVSVPFELGQLKNLTSLDLSRNHLTTVRVELGKLTKLTSLWLNNNQLTSIPAELGKLTNLTELRLQYNQLKTIPAELGKLKNLKKLYLYNNQLTRIPSEIGKLINLKAIPLFNNQLTRIPSELGKLTNLTELYLLDNQLTNIPSELGKLTKLKELLLPRNQLTNIPVELGKLTNLTILDLSGNKLTSIPAELGNLTKLDTLKLDGNKALTSPPPEVVKQGTKAILAYLRALAKEERPHWVSKLLFVGEGGVGKTSLLKRLLGEEFDHSEDTTHGLQIRTLEKPHPQDANVTMSLNAWDFGGQYVLHATHQFFLTGKSLFILVWNARHGWQQGKLYYWLDIIKAQAPESPVLIVATHTENWPSDLPYEEIRNKYTQVCGRFSVSNELGTGIAELEAAVRGQAAKLPLMGKARPASWLDAAEDVQELANSKEYIYPNELGQIMRQRKVTDEQEKASLAAWLHDLGYILYFKDNPDLSNIVILNPEWVASNISHMLEDAEIETGLGIFKKEHMEVVWPKIDPPIREVFLRLMEQFDLSFRTLENEDISIVVERLSLNPSGSAKGYEQLWDARQGENEIAMTFYLNTSLPPGIPTWFIARSHRFTMYKHWRYGALFADTKEQKHLALVRAYDHERYLTLATRGPAPHNLFALLRDGLELTLDRYPGFDIERKIPCPGHGNEGCPYEFDLKLVERALERGKKSVECHETGDNVIVSQLLYGLDMRADSAVIARLEVLSKQVAEATAATQDRVIGRVDSLEAEVVRDLGVILTELVELRELAQREFLSLFNRAQELAESDCPNVFAVLPKEGQSWLKNLLGQKMVMQLFCQAPGEWHQVVKGAKGGKYEIRKPSEFFVSLGPYILKLAKVIKYAAPVAGASAGVVAAGSGCAWMSVAAAKKLAAQIKLMEELAKKLTDRDYALAHIEAVFGERGKAERIEGMELRALRALLDKEDPQHEWGGLKKVLTPEGHYLWLCEYHAAEYKK